MNQRDLAPKGLFLAAPELDKLKQFEGVLITDKGFGCNALILSQLDVTCAEDLGDPTGDLRIALQQSGPFRIKIKDLVDPLKILRGEKSVATPLDSQLKKHICDVLRVALAPYFRHPMGSFRHYRYLVTNGNCEMTISRVDAFLKEHTRHYKTPPFGE